MNRRHVGLASGLTALLLLGSACNSGGQQGSGGAGGAASGGNTGTGAGGALAGSSGSGGTGGMSSAIAGSTGAGGAPAGSGGTGGTGTGGIAGGTGGTPGTGGGGSGGMPGTGGGGAGGGSALLAVAAPLNSSMGFKMVAPCGALNMSTLRSCDHSPRANCGNGLATFLRTDKTIGGTKGTFYDVKLHFRGIVEANQYSGGTSDHDGFYTGGQVSNMNGLDGGPQYNQYVLEVSSPMATFHLNNIDQDQRDMYRMGNAGSSGVHHFGFIIDYHKTIKVEGGATVSLYVLDNDCLFGRNCKPPADDFGHCDLQTFAAIPTDIVQPFDGNFIWIDVESVTPAP